ncbi:M20 family metallo-hydrolase [Aminipila terrae]|uniref:Hydantoinase/carbamoylase family amidase n=1 Tax=Aminipila terrae TaxID=2697030 RepID=A0A6P1MN65_9FIRM|nr:M20 family metallo-hydrolase [Aminipila terrae]QHI73106.1 hydantoinase/carbamoylase family amidase [Aminipila terrae]
MIGKLIEDISQFGRETSGGVTRLPFSKESYAAQKYLVDYMNNLGLNGQVDSYGTVWGHLEGKVKESIIISSHYDTVPNGGKYDGIVGIIVGLEVARYYVERNEKPYYSIDILAMNDEEGVRFSQGFLSSHGVCGLETDQLLEETRDINTGETLKNIITNGIHGDAGVISKERQLANVKRTIEVHVEQGTVLESADCPIGLVHSIVGLNYYYFTIKGEANHAGGTSMNSRKDALVTACKIISQIPEIAMKYPEAVATVGKLDVLPNAANVIPGEVNFSVDMRTCIDKDLKALGEDVERLVKIEVEKNPGITYEVTYGTIDNPAHMNEKMLKDLEAIVIEQGLKYLKLSSKAGHDSQILSDYFKSAMLFVPSKNGVSHSPLEYTDTKYIENAVKVLVKYVNKVE